MTPAEAIHEARRWLTAHRGWTESQVSSGLDSKTELAQLEHLKDCVTRNNKKIPRALLMWIDDAITELKPKPTRTREQYVAEGGSAKKLQTYDDDEEDTDAGILF